MEGWAVASKVQHVNPNQRSGRYRRQHSGGCRWHAGCGTPSLEALAHTSRLPPCRPVQPQKYTAYMFTSRLPPVFKVANRQATFGGRPCPTAPSRGGKVYKLDPACMERVQAFHTKHGGRYTVIIHGRSCGGMDHHSSSFDRAVHPARLVTRTGELAVADEDSWDLGCG